ncbi:hypothetical protein KQX54_016876 [Cotesia glomerata]|uniref:Uncharacterized protein n=1 Tax=Cotesia glomerata TaxID=32391 RepID=A0AAV7IED3_COTGL|nr:hypothetical protein KQX54_016876 [Cotesia glomerata]
MTMDDHSAGASQLSEEFDLKMAQKNKNIKSDSFTPKSTHKTRGRKTNAEKLLHDKNTRPLTPFMMKCSSSLDRRDIRSENLLLTIEQTKSILTDSHQESTLNNGISDHDNDIEESFKPEFDRMSTPNNKDLHNRSHDGSNISSSRSLENTIIETNNIGMLITCANCSKSLDVARKVEEENKELKLWITSIIGEFRKEFQDSLAEIKANQVQQPKSNRKSAERVHTQPKHLNPDAEKFLESMEHLKKPKPTAYKAETHSKTPKVINDQRLPKNTFIPRMNGSQDHRKTPETASYPKKHKQEQSATLTVNQHLPNVTQSSQNIKTYGTIRIHRQVERPGRLRADELESERKVRLFRRNNIVISEIQALKRVNNKIIVTLGSINIKKVIMAQKAKLKGSDVWVNDDYTPREAATQQWIESEAENEREQGKEAYTRYMKLWAKNAWWKWDDLKGNLMIMPFRIGVGESTGYTYCDWEGELQNNRNSQDKYVNAEGRILINLCEELGISIANGRIKGDEQGKVTFV